MKKMTPIEEFNEADLPEELRIACAKWGFNRLTPIQSLAIVSGVANGKGLFVSSPTSSGKTLIGELACFASAFRGERAVYFVSHKALADQKYVDFQAKAKTFDDREIAIGLSTGDRDEGPTNPEILITTYEKGLALILANQVSLTGSTFIADEFQIVCEDGRGPGIEILGAITRRELVGQFVALSATLGNSSEMADWLNLQIIEANHRDIKLFQEIWHPSGTVRVTFGSTEVRDLEIEDPFPTNILQVVAKNIDLRRAPILVFTESRKEAAQLAGKLSVHREITGNGVKLQNELKLFSEPTESSEQLQDNIQRGVVFHTADLTPQERQIVERGFSEGKIEVCFATSTLAAGVNFPFQTVVFPKLTYSFGDREGTMIAKSDYRNMSGRAGRLGLHEVGYAILLPRNSREQAHSAEIVEPSNDPAVSRLVRLSMRRTVLSLLSYQLIDTVPSLRSFFENTLYWHQIKERSPEKLDEVLKIAEQSLQWLNSHGFSEIINERHFVTLRGKAIAHSGLTPETALDFITEIVARSTEIDDDFENYIPAILHWVVSSPEFCGEKPARFLPYPAWIQQDRSIEYLRGYAQIKPVLPTETRSNNAAFALCRFCQGEAERIIRRGTGISSGQLHRLAGDASWVLDGLRTIAQSPDLDAMQTFTNKLAMLSKQVSWGAPPETLDILRIAQRENVPGFGRQRATSLLKAGITTLDGLVAYGRDALAALIGGDTRSEALLKAVTDGEAIPTERLNQTHVSFGKALGIADKVEAMYSKLGDEYELAALALLSEVKEFDVHQYDDGKMQNVSDLFLTYGDESAFIECKTTIRKIPLIKKEEAFSVLQKSADVDAKVKRICLGKPQFDESTKMKAQASSEITLVTNSALVEGVLRHLAGEITAEEFAKWLFKTGVSETERLGGLSTPQLIQQLSG